MTKVKDKLDKVTGWITSNQFTSEELYVLSEKIAEAMDRRSDMEMHVNTALCGCDNCVAPTSTALWPMDNLVGLQYRLDGIQKMKEDLMNSAVYPPAILANLKGTHADTMILDDIYAVDAPNQANVLSWFNNIPKQGKEHTMCYIQKNTTANATVVAVAADPEKDMREHLSRRLRRVYNDKTDKLYKDFYSVDEPKTKEEILSRLKSGKFTLEDSSFDKEGNLRPYDSAVGALSWRLAPVDDKGYEAARKLVADEYTKVDDTITVMSPEVGLEALRAFEAWQPTGKAN